MATRRRRAKQGEGIYLIKAILSDWDWSIRGRPYRILSIPGGFTLYGLAEAIVGAFDFDFDHAFGFYDNIKRRIDSEECYELFKDLEKEYEWKPLLEPSPCKSVKRTRISRVFNNVGKRMLFLFDYGDEWRFIVELRGVRPPERDVDYPHIIKSVGEAPPQYEAINEEDGFQEPPNSG